MNENTRGDRKFENLIIDEVDTAMIDEVNAAVRLSGHIPGTEYITWILIETWHTLNTYLKNVIYFFWLNLNSILSKQGKIFTCREIKIL